MLRKMARQRIELSRQLVLPLLLLSLLSVPWFAGGRDAFGLVVITTITLLLFASWLILSRDRALRMSLRPRLVIIPASILIGWSLVTWLWTASRYESTLWLTVLISASVIFVVARDAFRIARARVFYAKIFALSSVVVSLIGLFLYVGGDYERATSLFFWPNPFATYLLAVFPVAFALAIRKIDDRPNGWHYVSVLTAGMLMLTFSRAAWLIAILVIALSFWQSRDRRRFAITMSAVVLAGAGLAIAASGTRSLLNRPTVSVSSRLAESAGSSSVVDRLSFWREGAQMFADRPIQGWGAGAYREVHPAYQSSPVTATNNPHSSLVQSMVELGVVGFVATLVFMVGIVVTLWRDRNAERGYITRAAGLAVIGMGLHSMADLVSNYPALIVLLAIFLALALPLPDHAHEFRLKSRRVMVISLLIVGLLGGGVWMSYQVYLAGLDQAYIDAVAPLDSQEALVRYDDMLLRSIVMSNSLSQAALYSIDVYDSQTKSPDRSLLDSAAHYATEGSRLEPRDSRHWYALANASERQGRTTEALQAYRKAVEFDPYNNPQYQVSYARLLNREGFTGEALDVLRPVTDVYTDKVIANRNFVRISERLAIAWTLRAELESITRDKAAALESIRKARTLNPKYQPAIDLEKVLKAQ